MKQNQTPASSAGIGKGMSFRTRHFGTLTVTTSTYRVDGNLAVELVKDDGEPFAVLSVNLPESAHLLGEGEFFAKTWSENEEIAADALASGLFLDTGGTSGDDLDAPIWELR